MKNKIYTNDFITIFRSKNMATFGDSITINGFGNSDVNGIYSYVGEYNGYPMYQKGQFYVFYSIKYGEWSETASYYVIEKKQIQGSIPIYKPLYRLSGSNVESSNAWSSLTGITSGETQVGATVYEEASSSSSIDSSSSSSTSSSSSSSSSSTSQSSSSSSSI
jgi:hypothetical protein